MWGMQWYLPTALVLIEVRETGDALDNILGLVHDDHSGRTQATLHRLELVRQ